MCVQFGLYLLKRSFLSYAASNSELKARLYLSWISFTGPECHRNSQFGMCKSKRETEVCSGSLAYPATFLKRPLTGNFQHSLHITISCVGQREILSTLLP